MSTKERIIVVLWAILALSMTGCSANVQIGKTNTVHNRQKTSHRRSSDFYRLRKTTAPSMQETWERAHAK